MGNSKDPYSEYFEGAIKDEDELIIHARVKKNAQLLQSVAVKQFISAFHRGEMMQAIKLSKDAFSFPTARVLKIQLIYHCFYHGLVCYRLYRDGEGDDYLEEGKEMMQKVSTWHRTSPSTFENKLFLLEAEYFASLCNRNRAIEKFQASIKSARDNGFVHEQGLANGKHCCTELFPTLAFSQYLAHHYLARIHGSLPELDLRA